MGNKESSWTSNLKTERWQRNVLLHPPRPKLGATAPALGLSEAGSRAQRPRLAAAFLPGQTRRTPRKPHPAPGVAGLGRASQSHGPRPRSAPGEARRGHPPGLPVIPASRVLGAAAAAAAQPRPRGSAAHYLPRHDMAKRRRPKKRESPPEPAAADTALWPGAEEEAAEGAAEGGGGGRPFRVPLEPATQEQEAGAARRKGGGGKRGDVSSRAARDPRRWGPGGRGQRGGGGGGSSRSHGHGFPASRLRPPRRRCRTACWERGEVPTPLESGRGRGTGVRGVAIARQLWRGRGLRQEQGHLRGAVPTRP